MTVQKFDFDGKKYKMNEWYQVRNEIAESRFAYFSILGGHERLGSEIYIQYIEDNGVIWFALDSAKFNRQMFDRRIPVKLEFAGSNLDYSFTVTGLCDIVDDTDNTIGEEAGEFLVKTKLFYSVYKRSQNNSNLFKTISNKLTVFFIRRGKEQVKVLK